MNSFQDMVEEVGYETRSYSGRGMFGQQCLAIICDNTGKLFSDLIDFVECNFNSEERSDMYSDISQAFSHMKEDTLGRGTVVYFPQIKFQDMESEQEEC